MLFSQFYSVECLGIVTELFLDLRLFQFIDLTFNFFYIEIRFACSALWKAVCCKRSRVTAPNLRNFLWATIILVIKGRKTTMAWWSILAHSPIHFQVTVAITSTVGWIKFWTSLLTWAILSAFLLITSKAWKTLIIDSFASVLLVIVVVFDGVRYVVEQSSFLILSLSDIFNYRHQCLEFWHLFEVSTFYN